MARRKQYGDMCEYAEDWQGEDMTNTPVQMPWRPCACAK